MMSSTGIVAIVLYVLFIVALAVIVVLAIVALVLSIRLLRIRIADASGPRPLGGIDDPEQWRDDDGTGDSRP